MAKHIEQMTQDILIKKKTGINWSFILVFAGPLLATLILFISNIVGDTKPEGLLNWILVIVFIPLILTSLLVTQKRELVGAYGETILLLIPTFVWLLPGHDDSKRYMIIISLIVILIGLFSYTIGTMFRFMKSTGTQGKEEFRKKTVELLLRVGFIAANVTSTVVVSIILINWGDFTLELSKVAGKTEPDYSNKLWITFIAVITIFVALTLVILGLVSGVKKKFVETFDDRQLGIKPYKEKNKKNNKLNSSVTRTIEINIKRKKRWWRR